MKAVFLTRIVVVGVMMVSFSFRMSSGKETTIAMNGESQVVVVVAGDATEVEKHAASELADFLTQVTGGKFEVVNQYDAKAGRLLVGPGAAQLADQDFSVEGLGHEGLIIRTVGKDLILAGGRPRGTLYAVYTFLEDIVGCRWWTATVSTIPRKSTLNVDSLDIRDVPVLEYREPYWSVACDGDWAARNKCNGGRAGLAGKRGGSIVELGPCHSFSHYLPPDKYFAAHPEWFSEVKGKRISDNTQLCMTNEEMTQEFIKNVKADVQAHYMGAGSIWVSQNDWEGYCECPKCKEVNDREESLAGTNIYFANAVGDAVAAEFPGVGVRTFAYDWSQKPPKYAKVSPNVIIELCTTGCSYSQPYTHEQNKQFKERIEDWGKIADRIYIWDYLVNFGDYVCPHPNLRTLGPNVKFFADNHVKGVFGQGAWDGGTNGTELAELRCWVLSKLYWNPTRDGQKLIDEFLEGYYGPAAGDIRAFLDTYHDASEASQAELGMTQSPFSDNFLSFETMAQCLKHIEAAKAAVAGDKDLARRVEIAKMPVLYVFLMRWDEFQDKAKATGMPWPLDPEIKVVYDYFEGVRAKNDMQTISEKNARGQWPSVKERVDGGLPLVPPGCENFPRSRWVDLQDAGFLRNTYVMSVVKDESASDGSAVQMAGSSGERLNKQLWRVPLVIRAADAKQPLRVFLSIRCELIGKEGVAFKAGVDGKEQGLVVNCADIPDGDYHTYDMGVFDSLNGWIHLWIAPGSNPENVKTVSFDRAWLVTEASPAEIK